LNVLFTPKSPCRKSSPFDLPLIFFFFRDHRGVVVPREGFPAGAVSRAERTHLNMRDSPPPFFLLRFRNQSSLYVSFPFGITFSSASLTCTPMLTWTGCTNLLCALPSLPTGKMSRCLFRGVVNCGTVQAPFSLSLDPRISIDLVANVLATKFPSP